MSFEILQTPSPNFNDRVNGAPIDMLVLHYTGMKTAQEALDRMRDEDSEVSAHYMVDEKGKIYQLVDEKKRAWHAGISHWRGRNQLNDYSIGVEIVNPGHEFGYVPFPENQMYSVVDLCVDMVKRYKIKPHNVVGHSDIAPDRKQDPGELFDWKSLAKQGVGLWPDKDYEYQVEAVLEIGKSNKQVEKLQRDLGKLGYKITADGYFGVQTSYVVEAFQRHFAQARLDGAWDGNMQYILNNLINKC